MRENATLDAVLPLIEAGAALHWLVPFDKRPVEKEWASAARYTADQLREKHRKDANIGIRLGEPSKIGDLYLHLIDLDIKDGADPEAVWNRLLAAWPQARSFPTVQSGSGGGSRHIYFLTSKPFRKFKIDADRSGTWEIILMGTGSQAVLPPSIHPDTRKPYLWLTPLELDMPMLMEVSADLIESWGARETVEEGDSDDLDALVGRMPLDLEEDEIDEVLALIPNDGEGAHYDDYIEVGMALHHQFQGDEEGFDKWVAWGEQSSKFDLRHARYRWDKSFRENSLRPVRFATLIQKAQTNKLKDELDFETDDGFHAPAVVPQAAVGDLSDLLGGDSTDLTAPDPLPAGTVGGLAAPPADWQQLFHRNEDGELKPTLPNVKLMVNFDMRTFGVPAFNEFTQEVVRRKEPQRVRKKRDKGKDVLNLTGPLWSVSDKVNGELWGDSHDNAIRGVFEAPTTQGGYGIKISDRDLRGAVDIVAQENRFHPVREVLSKLQWDGKRRMDSLFVDYLGSHDTPYHRECARLMLLGAVTRIFEPGHKFDFVAILEGAQGKGKSTFIRTLGLHWYAELSGDVTDRKSMVEMMQGHWILEMGEMSSMARAEVNEMKAFVTMQVDKVRLSYAKRASAFPRQCIFIGSTNDKEYLRDMTGGRRWWPIECHLDGMIDNHRLAREVFQVWAEAVHEYHLLRKQVPFGELPLYLANMQSMIEANEIQESRRVETPEEVLAGTIQNWLDTPIGDDFEDLDGVAPMLRQETCMAQIWQEMMGREGSIPHTETIKIGKAMQLLPWDRSAGIVNGFEINKRYGRCRVYTRK